MSSFLDPHRIMEQDEILPTATATHDGYNSTTSRRDEITKLVRQDTVELLGPTLPSASGYDSDKDNDDDDDEEMKTKTTAKAGDEGEDGEEAGGSGMVNVSSNNMRNRKYSTLSRKKSLRNNSNAEEEDDVKNEEEDDDEDEKEKRLNNNNISTSDSNNNNGDGDGNLNRTTGKKSLKDTYEEMTAHEFSCRHRFFNIIHGDPVVSPDDFIASVYHTILILAILISIFTLILSSELAYYTPNDDDPVFQIFEYVSVAIFTVDIILQLASAETKENILHFQFAIDLTSILGFYISLIVTAATGQGANTGAFLILRIFRLTRVLRVLKVSSAANAMHLVITTLLNSKQGLLMLISLISVVTLLGGSILYFLEQQEAEFDSQAKKWYRDNGEESPFQSVPATFWFVVMTITTIGYGDVVPFTVLGRVATMILMLFGVLLLSFPNILIGAQFQLIHRSFQRDKSRKALGTVFRRARMIIRFVRMWREFSVRGTINELLDYDPLQQIPDEDDDEGELNLYADDDEEEEDEDDEEEEELKQKRRREEEEKAKNKKRESSLEYLLHVPEHMMKRHRHYVNFWFYPGEFPAINFQVSEKILQQGNFDRFTVGGAESGGSRFTALQFVQRLLESFSGCATADEIFESFALYPPYAGANIRLADVILMMLHLGRSRHLLVFCLSRTDESFVCALSKSGLTMVRTFPEDGLVTCPCFRSLSSASQIWKRTTKKALPLDSPYGFDGYPRWQVAQALVPRVDVTSFTENLRLHSSRRNHVVFLKSGFKPRYHNAVSFPSVSAAASAQFMGATSYNSKSGPATNQNSNNNNNNNSNSVNSTHGQSHYSKDHFVHAGGVQSMNFLSTAEGANSPTKTGTNGNQNGNNNNNKIRTPQQTSLSANHQTSFTSLPTISMTGQNALADDHSKDVLVFSGSLRADQAAAAALLSGESGHQYCEHCIHCQSQAAILPQTDVDPLWKSKQNLALSEFVWTTDEQVIEMQIEYLQNWLSIIRHCKKHPQKVKRPL